MRQNVEPLYWLRHSSTHYLNSNLILSAIVFGLHLYRVETIILNDPEWLKQECNLIPLGPVSANGMFFSQQRRSFYILIFQLCNHAQFWENEWVSELWSVAERLPGKWLFRILIFSLWFMMRDGEEREGGNPFTTSHLYVSFRKVRCFKKRVSEDLPYKKKQQAAWKECINVEVKLQGKILAGERLKWRVKKQIRAALTKSYVTLKNDAHLEPLRRAWLDWCLIAIWKPDASSSPLCTN